MSFFVVTDVKTISRDEHITGYWTGQDLSDTVGDAVRYPNISTAEEVLRTGNFRDPVVYEVEQEEDGSYQMVRFIDFVNTYGFLGGK